MGEPACRELLDVLERSDEDRAALIGLLHASGQALAEIFADVETDPDDLTATADRRAPRGALGAFAQAVTLRHAQSLQGIPLLGRAV